MQRGDTGRLHFLDSLRGLAALYVVFFHLLMVPQPRLSMPVVPVSQVIHFGATGVFLFFLISGFSLSLTMPRHDRAALPAASYGLSRLFRIAPLFWFMIIVSLIRDVLVFGRYRSPGEIMVNASFLFNFVPGQQEGIVWASWTIGVEMLFYALFLPIYRARPKYQAVIAATSLILFYIAKQFMDWSYYYFLFLGFFPLFVIGMLSFELYDRLRIDPRSRSIGSALIAAGLVILTVLCALPVLAGATVALRVPIALGYAALLLGCGLRRPALLEAAPLLFYGRISYSLYLVHSPIIYQCGSLYRALFSMFPPVAAYLICAAVTLSIATPVAYLTYRLIEVPGNRLGKLVLSIVLSRFSRRATASGL